MNQPTHVTVPTLDHGPVVVPEPAWCTGHNHPHTEARDDVTHTGPIIPFNAPTSRGEVTLMLAALEQRPFATHHAPGTETFVNVELAGEDWYPSTPDQLDALADALVEHATTLRHLARQLATLRAGEAR
ncbi:DUF6907 domain-containing protein [Streptomyces sp. NPDC090026]|uniref:DUF6907 domain-containing protein n=1 Tax=Streptomyces sp. NPDC090026 TaxID=3365923 RepID=UPI00381D66D9